MISLSHQSEQMFGNCSVEHGVLHKSTCFKLETNRVPKVENVFLFEIEFKTKFKIHYFKTTVLKPQFIQAYLISSNSLIS
ncbi:hypothetical protein T4A_10588 [Trichinella pseudospiralis]|uniref:Uncharacterized protein n=1 Tax=Trichinella pseudospiralis TaxID=6337 RepID=A0A0V1ETF3_TRIPS|nr:hypothetical protein T4A_10588 [Trichinella pseudospiralis]